MNGWIVRMNSVLLVCFFPLISFALDDEKSKDDNSEVEDEGHSKTLHKAQEKSEKIVKLEDLEDVYNAITKSFFNKIRFIER